MTRLTKEEFDARITKLASGCWMWPVKTKNPGRQHYGSAYGQRANRASYELHFGPIPDGLHVLHRCDNPPCVNPAHLFLGTTLDNTNDMILKGRGASKITAAQAAEIRALAATKTMTHEEMAARYGITRTQVSHVIHGHNWKDRTLPPLERIAAERRARAERLARLKAEIAAFVF